MMIDHLHNLASVVALSNQIGGCIHGHLQFAFDWYLSCFGKSYFWADVLGGMGLAMASFWILGTLYTILDLTQWPGFLYQYKTQDKNVCIQYNSLLLYYTFLYLYFYIYILYYTISITLYYIQYCI